MVAGDASVNKIDKILCPREFISSWGKRDNVLIIGKNTSDSILDLFLFLCLVMLALHLL